MRFGLGKTHMTARVTFAGLGRALADQRAGRTHFSGEVGDEGFHLAAAMDWLGLSIWAGDLDRFAILVEFDGEIGQLQFLRIGSAPADGGLNMLDLLFLQGQIGSRAAMPAIGVDRLQFRAGCGGMQAG